MAFLLVLKDSFVEQPSAAAIDFQKFVVDIVREFFILPQQPTQLSALLQFVLGLLNSTSHHELHNYSALSFIEKILLCLLACEAAQARGEPPNIRKLSLSILRIFLKCTNRDDETRLLMMKQFKSFVKTNLLTYQGAALKTLQSIVV